ncbi:MAG: 2-oxoacid:acceptor oxidoreductase family protein [Pseudomonadota bacterium]
MLEKAKLGGLFLLNSPVGPRELWDTLPLSVQSQIIEKKIAFHAIDAYRIADQLGLGHRINTIMQACLFAISGILPWEKAIAAIKHAARESYARAGLRMRITVDKLAQYRVCSGYV